MGNTSSGILTILTLVAALAICYRPLGDYLAHVVTTPRHWRVEKVVYKVVGADPEAAARYAAPPAAQPRQRVRPYYGHPY